MAIGDYPVEYNPKVHGPYDPARYYGTPDTPFSQLKLGEVTIFLLNNLTLLTNKRTCSMFASDTSICLDLFYFRFVPKTTVIVYSNQWQYPISFDSNS